MPSPATVVFVPFAKFSFAAEIVYVFLPVVASTAGVTVIPSPCTTSVPKPVITFLPASVMLDKFLSANGAVALVIAVLTAPAVASLLASSAFVTSAATTGVTVISPLLFATVNVFASPEVTDFTGFKPEIVAVSVVSLPLASSYFNVTVPFSTVYACGLI